MSRLAAREKLEFMPTNLDIVELIARHIRITGTNAHQGVIFDPTAGDGKAVQRLTDLLNERFDNPQYALDRSRQYSWLRDIPHGKWVAHGVEIQEHLHAELKEAIEGQALNAALEQVRRVKVEGHADIIFLNPPYDNVSGRRIEPEFVKMALPFMKTGGLMILVLPDKFLEGRPQAQLRKVLNGHISDIHTWALPSELHAQWKQVVIMITTGSGYCHERHLQVRGVLGEVDLEREDYSYQYQNITSIHRIGYSGNFQIEIDPDSSLPVASVFTGGTDSLNWLIGEPGAKTAFGRPLLDMGEPHAAMMAAAGALNGVQIEDGAGKSLVIRGSSFKIEVKKEEVKKDGDRNVTTTTIAEQFVVQLAVLNMDTGNVSISDSYHDPQTFESVLLANAKSFTAAARGLYPPILDGAELVAQSFHVEKLIRAPSVLKGHDNGLFDKQKECVVAVMQAWKDGEAAILDGEMSSGKTAISLAAAALRAQQRAPGNRHIVVILPPKDDLLLKWEREAKRALRMLPNPDGTLGPKVFKIGIEKYPNANGGKMSRPYSELREAFAEQGLTVILMKSTTAKLGDRSEDVPLIVKYRYTKRASYDSIEGAPAWLLDQVVDTIPHESGTFVLKLKSGKYAYFLSELYYLCPICMQKVPPDDLGEGRERKCPMCGTPLWTYVGKKTPKIPVYKYLVDRFSKKYILVIDECFPAGTPVMTPDGEKPIEKIEVGDTVLSYKDSKMVARKVTNTICKPLNGELVKVITETGELICTPNHKIYVDGQYVEAGNLKFGANLTVLEDRAIMHSTKEVSNVIDRAEDMRDMWEGVSSTPPGTENMQLAMRRATKKAALSPRQPTELPNKDMRILREGICGQETQEIPQVLQQILLWQSFYDARESKGIRRAYAYTRTQPTLLRANEEEQSHVQPRDKGQGDRQCKGARVVFGEARRQWEVNAAAGSFGKSTGRWLADGISNHYGQSEMACRSSGYSQPIPDDSNRGRRSFTSSPQAEEQRPHQSQDDTGRGLDSAAVLELGDREELGTSAFTNSRVLSVEKIAAPDQYVYNLTVEDTHCYFAAGVLVSNCHNSKGIGNVISSAVNSLSSHAFKTLQMTGTLINGMASSLFQILYRSSYKFRQLYEFGEIQRFINKYGLYEQITKEYERHIGDYASGPKKIKRGKSERPGIAPAMVAELLPMTAFISLRDLEFDMVSYQENTLFVDAPAKLHTAVTRFLEAGKGEAAAEAYNGNYTPMGQLRAARLCTTNLPFGPDSIGTVSYCAPDLPDSILFPKEEALVRLILDAKNRGRKVMVFTGQIKARDPTPRLLSILERYGLKGVVMRAKVKKRVPFLEDALKNGADAVFCSPGLVSEGIDLPMFSTAVWYSPNYSAFITPQANRRFWRLNQEQSVEVYYLAYNELPESTAFVWIAEKLAAQQALRGDIRAGIARLLGKETFVSKLQDAVVEDAQHLESDISMSSLPPLPILNVKKQVKSTPELIAVAPSTVKIVKVEIKRRGNRQGPVVATQAGFVF